MCKMSKQDCKVFIGGLSWETTGEKLRAYFENYGVVREAFVSYNRNNGRPRGFGFVVFESPEVADKVVATKHTIDRREVEAKKAVPKDDQQQSSSPPSSEGSVKTKKIFVGGLAPSVDEKLLRQYFEQFGVVEDAVVMYDHDNKRPRGFGFVTFAQEESVEKVFAQGVMQTILDKQIEIKPAVPRDQMPPPPRSAAGNPFFDAQQRPYGGPPPRGHAYPYGPAGLGNALQQFGSMRQQYGGGPRGYIPIQPNLGPGAGPRGGRGFGPQQLNSGPTQFPGSTNAPLGSARFNPQSLQQPTNIKVSQQAGYDQLYSGFANGAGNVFGANSQALYNLGTMGYNAAQLNGMQSQTGPVNNKLGTFGQNINLKALGALASSFGGFPSSQPEGHYPEEAGSYGAQDAEYASEAVNLNNPVVPDFNSFHDTNFTSPAPGWSS